MRTLDEELELLNQKHIQQGYTLEQLQQEQAQQNEQRPYTNTNDLPTLLGAAGLGAGNMVNNTILGGLGQALGNIGAGVEWISPFSGSQDDKVIELMRLGVPLEQAREIYPHQDSWITSAAKGVLEGHNAIADTLGDWRNQLLGDNPTFAAQVAEGTGSSLGFAATGLLGKAKTGSTLAGALLSGLTEALSESGGTMGEAYKQGMYDEGLTTANKSLAANIPLNLGLNLLSGRFAPYTDNIRNPLTRFGVQTLGEVANELIQEPSQQTIEKAANRDLYNGEDFIPALTDEAGSWGQTFRELAPSVAASTLLTQALMGSAAMAHPGIRQNVQDQYKFRNVENEDIQRRLTEGTERRQKLVDRLNRAQSEGERQTLIDNINTRIGKVDRNIERYTQILKSRNALDLDELGQIQEQTQNQEQTITEDVAVPEVQSEQQEQQNEADIQNTQSAEMFPVKDRSSRVKTADPEIVNPETVNPVENTQPVTVQNSEAAEAGIEETGKKDLGLFTARPDMESFNEKWDREHSQNGIPQGQEVLTNHEESDTRTPVSVENFKKAIEANRDEETGYVPMNVLKESLGWTPQEFDGMLQDLAQRKSIVLDENNNSVAWLYRELPAIDSTDLSHINSEYGIYPRKHKRISSQDEDTKSQRERTEPKTPHDVSEQIEAVHKQYEGTDQWLKAPNRKASNLKEKQWLQVRTPNFKRWFGNWNYDGNTQVKVTDITTAAAGFGFDDVKSLRKWLVGQYSGKTIQIASDGSIVGFSTKKIRDSLKGTYKDGQISSYSALEDLVKNALYYDFEKNDGQLKHRGLIGQDVYYSAMKLGDKLYSVKFKFDVADETLSKTYKGHKVSEIQISPATNYTRTQRNNLQGTYTPAGDTLIITLSELTNGVKPKNVSQSVDENGEPLAVKRDGQLVFVNNNGQTKSATDNNGMFNGNNPDIYAQSEDDSSENGSLNAKRDKENSNSKYDGFVGSLDVDHFDETHSVNVFADEHNGTNYLDITDENGNSVATYDIDRKSFAIRPQYQKEGWVRRIQDSLKRDLGKNPEAEITRRIFKEKAINAGQSEILAENLSQVYNAVNNFTAKWTGLSPLQIAKLDNLTIEKADGNTNKRGETRIIRQKLDSNGNVIQEAQTIVRLFQTANKSTLLHEMSHVFLERLRKLAVSGALKGDRNRARLDWRTIVEKYGLQSIDFSKDLNERNKKLWKNANEKFASGFERYFMEGNAPTSKLQRVFDTFKNWLSDIYQKLSNIKYTDANGDRQSFNLSKEIRGVFDDMLGGNGELQNRYGTSQNQQVKPAVNAQKTGQNNSPNPQQNQDIQTPIKSDKNASNGIRDSALKRIINAAKNGLHSLFNVAHVARKPDRNTAQDFSYIDILNPETELGKRFRAAENVDLQRGIIPRIAKHAREIIQSLKGDFPELAGSGNSDFHEAREWFRQNNRAKHKAVSDVLYTMHKTLKPLNKNQKHLLNAYMNLADFNWRISDKPEYGLPFNMTADQVKKQLAQVKELAQKDSTVWNAIQELNNSRKKLTDSYITQAALLGIDRGSQLRNPAYFAHRVIEYAQASSIRGLAPSAKGNVDIEGAGAELASRGWLKRWKGSTLDIITDYQQANGEVLMQMAQDIETMKLLVQLKKKFDYMPKIVEQLRESNGFKSQDSQQGTLSFSQNGSEVEAILENVPNDHDVFIPAGSRLIEGNKSSYTNALLMAAEDIARENGKIPVDKVFELLGADDEDIKNGILVLPKEIVSVLRRMAKDRKRGALGKIAKDLTTFWKKSVLFTPFRTLKYNFRNFTGDIDALIAGNPHALKQLGRSTKELTAFFLKKGVASQDLQDYIDRTGGSGIPSLNLSAKDAQTLLDLMPIKEPGKNAKQETIDKYNDKILARDERIKARLDERQKQTEDAENIGNVRKVWNATKSILGKAYGAEVGFTEWREHLLRYAAYLDYKEQMEKNGGKPKNWGASIEAEVMAVKDIKDRAYKMSNELLGAYDQVSEVGQQLRDMLVPFYSWIEVNAKRYYRLFKNAHKRGETSYMAKQALLGKVAALPFYAVPASMSVAKILAFTALTQMFNRTVFPDADDDLPDDVKYRPHLTFGNFGGDVFYFDRIGALADIGDWLSLDSIFLDTKDIMSGQETLGGYMKKMIQAPVNKAINALNPGIKMPIELAMGRSMFPDVFHPSTIRDPVKYVANSFGLSYPYKLITGEPHSTKQEVVNFFTYSRNPEEAAYWQTLDKVRQFQNNVLDKHFDGFATTKRGTILRNLKTALRYDDKEAVRRYLREYAQADGTKQGLKASMKAMNPLHGLSTNEKKQFLKWLTPRDRQFLRKAERYYHQLADRYVK